MFFLVEYDRQKGKIGTFKEFDKTQRHAAEDARLALELELQRQQVEREVVILEATDEAALRKTHRRYFESIDSLAKSGI